MMGKESDLWDDSALINAFDDAISKYKIMHSKGSRDGSSKEGKAISNTEENLSAIGDESYATKRHTGADNNNNVASNHMKEMGETINPSSIKENCSVDSCAPEHHISSSNGQHVQDVNQIYSNTQGAEDYNNLLNQYNELEEQRQKILQQLYQLGSWNNQGSGSSVQWGTSYTAQENQAPEAQASFPTVACSCCSYVCPCLLAPCTSLPACSSKGTCVSKTCDVASAIGHKEKPISLEDGDIINTAMGAAERALCSLKTNVSGVSDINKEKEGEVETNVGQLAQKNSSETDLTVVLNAWYSAGFYTGKKIDQDRRIYPSQFLVL